jgi:large subunit ribosomal protein L2
MSAVDRSGLSHERPPKKLSRPLQKKGGRNFQGFITCRHHGGGHKQRYRFIDFKRDKDGIPARVETIEYDPNRSCHIALVCYSDGERRYILAAHGLVVGDSVVSGERVEPKIGCTMPLSSIPLGLEVHNVELTPGSGGKMARSAGTVVTLMAREGDYAVLGLPSGEHRKIHVACRATIGRLSNIEHDSVTIGKAGRNRHLGIRPTVRGSAMNPVAHPMGGGEGRRSGGRHPVSPTGKLSKGGKTRSKRKTSSRFILRRRPPGTHQTGE